MISSIINLNDYISIDNIKKYFNSSIDNSIRLITDIKLDGDNISGQIIEEAKDTYYFWRFEPYQRRATYFGAIYKDRKSITTPFNLTYRLSNWFSNNTKFQVNNHTSYMVPIILDKKVAFNLL